MINSIVTLFKLEKILTQFVQRVTQKIVGALYIRNNFLFLFFNCKQKIYIECYSEVWIQGKFEPPMCRMDKDNGVPWSNLVSKKPWTVFFSVLPLKLLRSTHFHSYILWDLNYLNKNL